MKITEVFQGGFFGIVHTDDERKVYLAGSPECLPGHVSVFHDHLVSTKEEFESEDWSKWISRVEKKKRKS